MKHKRQTMFVAKLSALTAILIFAVLQSCLASEKSQPDISLPVKSEITLTQLPMLFGLAERLQLSGQYAEAENLYNTMLAQLRENQTALTQTKHLAQQARILTNLGYIQHRYGAYQKALLLHRQSYQTYMTSLGKAHIETLHAQADLARTYLALKQYDQARALLNDAATQLRLLHAAELPLYLDDHFVMPHLALAYSLSGENTKAETIYQRVHEFIKQSYPESHPRTILSLIELADLHLRQDRLHTAAKFSQQALANAGVQTSPELLARIYFTLARIRQQQASFSEAIFYGKQSINQLQLIRSGQSEAEKSIRYRLFDDPIENHRRLSLWLVEANRVAETEQVLAMLKEEEYFNFVRRDEKFESSTELQMNPIEQTQKEKLDQARHLLTAYRTELLELQITRDHSKTDKVAKRIVELQHMLPQAEQAFQASINEVKQAFAPKHNPENNGMLQGDESYNRLIKRLGDDVALIHFIPAKNKLHIILHTTQRVFNRSVAIDGKYFNQLISEYRKILTDGNLTPATDEQMRRISRQLFSWLIEPIEPQLQQSKIKTLMFYTDGPLRYVPMATLYKDKQYLIERYSVSNYTAVARQSLNKEQLSSWSIAGMGVSKQIADFPPLPMVTDELDGIVKTDEHDTKGVFKGVVFVNENFTAAQLKTSTANGYNIAHIATHYKLESGTERDSFMLLGDGNRLTLAMLRTDGYDFNAIDLLTLSACDTGLNNADANGREVEGLAAIVQRRGAGAVLATLWQVADCSTGQFMQLFYQHRSNGLTKADALRQSQLDFIHNEIPVKAIVHKQPEQGCQLVPAHLANGYQHPYYWASFILMGNWR